MPRKDPLLAFPLVGRRFVHAICSPGSYGDEFLAGGMAERVDVRLIYLCGRESQCMVASELAGSVAGEMPIIGQ